MKKITMLIILVMSMMLTGCNEATCHENGVPSYFLEPEGHIIVKIDILSDDILTDEYLYGYITNEDYQAYLNGELKGVLVVKHPYEEGKSVITNVDMIESMQVGVYEDCRY